MVDLLRSHIQKRVNISDEEFARCRTFFSHKKLRKKQYWLQEGDVCRSIGFVLKGCLRNYTVDAKGEEHIIQFAIEDWWVSDIYSFLSGTPSKEFIDALEDSDLLVLDRSSRDAMLDAVPKMERFFRLLLEANLVATRRRVASLISDSAEQRYLDFLKSYPNLVERVPLNQIASFLGITPQSLSRIRKELSEKR
ncbi:MAG TPA: Crp/Fnr family transcriptional regulator [Bacteroidota bacterium]|nr:Crp/Fnr family transcriptional regulator [Bacteroidota bacterium]